MTDPFAAAEAALEVAEAAAIEAARPRPVLFLTNAASSRAARKGNAKKEVGERVGPGDQFTIQRHPELIRGECGRGAVPLLIHDCPLDSVEKSALSREEYRDQYLAAIKRRGPKYGPGRLRAHLRREIVDVQAGDTLTCRCSSKAAAKGLCHRVWAAAILSAAGWKVILDGREIDPAKAEGLLS